MSKEIIGAVIEVPCHPGAGLLESTCEECLHREFIIRSFAFERQEPLAVFYKGIKLDCGCRMYIVAGSLVILELKAIDKIETIHDAQL